MAQDPIAPLDPGVVGGVELAQELVDFEQTLLTQHSGSSRPSYAQAGTLWLDTTTTPWLWKLYDGSSDIIIAAFSASSHRHREGVAEATIASGSTTDVLGSTSKFIAISGTGTITSLGSEPNQIKFVRATGAFTLTHNGTSLVLPTAANITAASGDTFIVTSDSSGNARVFAYQRASGGALSVASSDIPSGTVMLFFQTSAPTGWTKDTSNFNDHAIRIVTGTPSSGGSLNFSTVMGYTATQNYTLLAGDIPAHTHGPGTLAGTIAGTTNSTGAHTHGYNNSNDNTAQASSGTARNVGNKSDDTNSAGNHSHTVTGTHTVDSGVTGSLGGSGAHAHNIDMRVRYVDAIRATRN